MPHSGMPAHASLAQFYSLRQPKASQVIDSVMVEAGGVEPPSEKARHEETTCVSGSLIVGRRFKTGESGASLARLDLSRRLRTEAIGLSRKMTLTHRRAGSAAGAAT